MIVRGMMGQTWLKRTQLKSGYYPDPGVSENNKCNFCLVVCEISTPYVKRNESYELEKNDGSNGTGTIKRQIYTQAYFIIQVHFDPSFLSWSYFSCLWHTELQLYTHLDKSCRYHYWYIAPFINYCNFLHHSFLETPGTYYHHLQLALISHLPMAIDVVYYTVKQNKTRDFIIDLLNAFLLTSVHQF